jgi:peroxiredoxin Q/BCP
MIRNETTRRGYPLKQIPLLLRLLLLGLFVASSLPASAELKEGDPAPDFSVMGSDGKLHALSDSLGSNPVVIAFFPKAFTGG